MARGIELTDGDYARCVREGCGLLSDAINLSQRGLDKARRTAAAKLDQLRQVLHEKTAPKPPPPAPAPKPTRAKKMPPRSMPGPKKAGRPTKTQTKPKKTT